MYCKQTTPKKQNIVKRLVFKPIGIWAGALLAVTFSAGANAAIEAPMTLEQAQSSFAASGYDAQPVSPEKNLRATAMREAAQSYGARAGLLHHTDSIRKNLDRAAASFDAIYNFGTLMLVDQQKDEQGVLRSRDIIPPVIVKEDASFKQDSNTIIHKGGPNFHIFAQAQFAPIPPTWRSYLYRSLGEDSAAPPPDALRPQNAEEQARFKSWIAEGWAAGIQQANSIHKTNLNRLDRDFNGMALYYDLVAQNMVTLPFVATSNAGVAGDATHLRLNDVTLRITVMPAFRLDSSKWTPVAQ